MADVTWEDLLYPGRAPDFFVCDTLPQFRPHDAGYNTGNAWWLAQLSRLIYRCDATAAVPAVSDVLQRVQLQQLERFSSPLLGTQALLVQSLRPEPFAVLVFRGTEQKLQDFLHDADARLIPMKTVATPRIPTAARPARVHRGFARALDSVWPRISNALPRDRPLFFTGHSLGAALAILAASRHAPRAVYAFGAPRVGDSGFATLLRGLAVHRVVHGDDIVCGVPPTTLGYQHVGTAVRIGTAVMNQTTLDIRRLWSAFGRPPKAFADHAPVNYCRHL